MHFECFLFFKSILLSDTTHTWIDSKSSLLFHQYKSKQLDLKCSVSISNSSIQKLCMILPGFCFWEGIMKYKVGTDCFWKHRDHKAELPKYFPKSSIKTNIFCRKTYFSGRKLKRFSTRKKLKPLLWKRKWGLKEPPTKTAGPEPSCLLLKRWKAKRLSEPIQLFPINEAGKLLPTFIYLLIRIFQVTSQKIKQVVSPRIIIFIKIPFD